MKRYMLAALAVSGCTTELGTSSQNTTCTATNLFAETVCICENFRDVGNLVVGSSVATDKATLAVMGTSKVINNMQVHGSFVPLGGLEATGNLEVTGDLYSAAHVDDLGNIDIGGNLAVGGDLTGIGRLAVGGELSVAGRNAFFGYKEINAQTPYQNTSDPACGCADADILDVVGAVATARQQNDNAARGVPTSIRNIGLTVQKLTTGSYYMTDLSAIGATKLAIEGHVSLYLEGDLEHIGAAWIRLENGAMLDLYVSGSVRTIGHVDLGNKWAPSSFRLYVGGADKATISVGNQIFNGAIYAPRAELTYVGNTKIRGAVTAKEIHGVGNLEIGYAAPECPSDDPDPTPPPPPSQDDPPVIL